MKKAQTNKQTNKTKQNKQTNKQNKTKQDKQTKFGICENFNL